MATFTSYAKQDQRGLLREDFDLLCHFLGIEIIPSPTQKEAELSDTQEPHWKEQSLSEAAMINDVLLVSIEFIDTPERLWNGNHGSCQLGLTILDTRKLKAMLSYNAIMPYPAFVAAGSILQTHHFCIGSTAYYNISSSSFSFGTSKHVTIPELHFSLQQLLSGREALLVVNDGHGSEGALTFLQAAQIAAPPFPMIETQKTTPNHPDHPDKDYVSAVAEYFYDARYKVKYYDCTVDLLSLGRVAYPFTSDTKHNAGNASRYTLCLLLNLLASALDTRSWPWSTPLPPTVAALKSIADAPYGQLSRPPRSDPRQEKNCVSVSDEEIASNSHSEGGVILEDFPGAPRYNSMREGWFSRISQAPVRRLASQEGSAGRTGISEVRADPPLGT